MQETWVRSLGWEDPLEEGKATHSSILAWRIPWTVKSMGSQRVGHDWVTFTLQDIGDRLNICTLKKKKDLGILKPGLPQWLSGTESACQCKRHKRQVFNPWIGTIPCRRAWQPTPVFLLGESHGQKSLAGYSPQGHKESGISEMTEHVHILKTYLSPQFKCRSSACLDSLNR